MKPQRKRLKWEPGALMALVLALGLWIAFGPASSPSFPTAPDSTTQTVRIGNTRGLLEASRPNADAGSPPVLRLWISGAPQPPREMSIGEAEALLGPNVVAETLGSRRNWVFRALNITSWTNLVWVGIGLLGQLAFSGRMVLQWIVSEKRRQSVITESFWWFSLFGGLTLFSYFVFRQDPVGILGQTTGIVIYARNLRLIYKQRRRLERSAAAEPHPAHPPPSHSSTAAPPNQPGPQPKSGKGVAAASGRL